MLPLNKLLLFSSLCCLVVFCTISCRTYPNTNNSETLAELPFDMDSLRYYNSVKFKKWTEEEMQYADSTQDIRYYKGGVLLQSKPKLQSSDTMYIPDVTGIPREKLNTLTRQVPAKTGYRLASVPPEYVTCTLDSVTSQTAEFCRPIYYVVPPASREVITYYILNPKYEKDYPDGLPMEMKIYDHVYSDESFAVSWEKWEEIRQDSSSYFSHPIPAGYYSLSCNEDFKTQCRIMQLQQALKNRGYDVPLSGRMDNATKAALTRFGKDNGLPIPHHEGVLTWFPELSELEN